MIDHIKQLITEAEVFTADSKEEVEAFRIKYLGKKGLMNTFFAEFKNIPHDQKREFGQIINQLKTTAQNKVSELKQQLESKEQEAGVFGDLTRPGQPVPLGARHPISIVKNHIIEIFSRIGFNVSEGPEIEDDWHNFTALNLPEYHPARDMQDTFFIQNRSRYSTPNTHQFGPGTLHGTTYSTYTNYFTG
jgi:phenylalanyl-tRNA synthetase alpha chain